MILRLLAALCAIVAVVLSGTAAAGAIETRQFGIEPVPNGGPRSSFRLDVRAGETTTDTLRIWNKTDAPLRVRLTVVPATLDSGEAELGGDGAAVDWVDMRSPIVDLPPSGERRVAFEVKAPHKLSGEVETVALMAEPVAAPGQPAPAVLERVAVMAYFSPAEGAPLTAADPGGASWLGDLLPWVATALLVIVAASAVRRARRQRPALAAIV